MGIPPRAFDGVPTVVLWGQGRAPQPPRQEAISMGVGGRLIHFTQAWPAIDPDHWVLMTVSEGYRIEFTSSPPTQLGVRKTPLPRDLSKRDLLLNEVSSLLEKNAISPLVPPYEEGGFWSTFFLAPKRTGDWRPILNLKPLNQYIKPKRFRMETLRTVMSSPIKGKWATSIDLKDAYLHVPIHPIDRKWLRFHIQGKAYVFRCLPFGLSTSPRVFTRIVKAVAAFLRRQNIQIHMYLDDWIITSSSREEALGHLQIVLDTVKSLGFLVNLKKSSLIPSQFPLFLGARLDLKLGRATPSMDRVSNMVQCAGILKASASAPAVAWLRVLGLMASLVDLVPWCRFHMRPIQLHLLYFYIPSRHHIHVLVPMSDVVRRELEWWEDPANLLVGVVFPTPSIQVILTTDASSLGWGGHLESRRSSGVWSPDESRAHINLLELWAVFNALRAFEEKVLGKRVQVKTDNSTVVAYINRQGGTKSPSLCLHTRVLLRWCIQRGISLFAVHIPGKLNTLADNLSRGVSLSPTEWSLSPQVAQTLFVEIFQPSIDLFASIRNHKLPVYCSRSRDERALATDALSISWRGMTAYAFPPISLIAKVLQKIEKEDCLILLIAPFWPRQHWFHSVMKLIVGQPYHLPLIPDLLRMPGSKVLFHDLGHLHLTAWPLSRNVSRRKAFLESLPNWRPRDAESRHTESTLRVCDPTIAGVSGGKLLQIEPLLG